MTRNDCSVAATLVVRILSLVLAGSMASFAMEGVGGGYRLSSGDVVNISVFGEEKLSFPHIRLTDAGTFSYPFLGIVEAQGLTATELEQTIIDGLKGDYLLDPKVSVSILEYREFFVNGQVKSPGGYSFKPGLTLQKAIALAGGFTDRASRSKFTLIRENGGEGETIEADLSTPIQPGDIITIEQRFF